MSDQEYEKKTLVSEIEESLLKGAGVRNGSQSDFTKKGSETSERDYAIPSQCLRHALEIGLDYSYVVPKWKGGDVSTKKEVERPIRAEAILENQLKFFFSKIEHNEKIFIQDDSKKADLRWKDRALCMKLANDPFEGFLSHLKLIRPSLYLALKHHPMISGKYSPSKKIDIKHSKRERIDDESDSSDKEFREQKIRKNVQSDDNIDNIDDNATTNLESIHDGQNETDINVMNTLEVKIDRPECQNAVCDDIGIRSYSTSCVVAKSIAEGSLQAQLVTLALLLNEYTRASEDKLSAKSTLPLTELPIGNVLATLFENVNCSSGFNVNGNEDSIDDNRKRLNNSPGLAIRNPFKSCLHLHYSPYQQINTTPDVNGTDHRNSSDSQNTATKTLLSENNMSQNETGQDGIDIHIASIINDEGDSVENVDVEDEDEDEDDDEMLAAALAMSMGSGDVVIEVDTFENDEDDGNTSNEPTFGVEMCREAVHEGSASQSSIPLLSNINPLSTFGPFCEIEFWKSVQSRQSKDNDVSMLSLRQVMTALLVNIGAGVDKIMLPAELEGPAFNKASEPTKQKESKKDISGDSLSSLVSSITASLVGGEPKQNKDTTVDTDSKFSPCAASAPWTESLPIMAATPITPHPISFLLLELILDTFVTELISFCGRAEHNAEATYEKYFLVWAVTILLKLLKCKFCLLSSLKIPPSTIGLVDPLPEVDNDKTSVTGRLLTMILKIIGADIGETDDSSAQHNDIAAAIMGKTSTLEGRSDKDFTLQEVQHSDKAYVHALRTLAIDVFSSGFAIFVPSIPDRFLVLRRLLDKNPVNTGLAWLDCEKFSPFNAEEPNEYSAYFNHYDDQQCKPSDIVCRYDREVSFYSCLLIQKLCLNLVNCSNVKDSLSVMSHPTHQHQSDTNASKLDSGGGLDKPENDTFAPSSVDISVVNQYQELERVLFSRLSSFKLMYDLVAGNNSVGSEEVIMHSNEPIFSNGPGIGKDCGFRIGGYFPSKTLFYGEVCLYRLLTQSYLGFLTQNSLRGETASSGMIRFDPNYCSSNLKIDDDGRSVRQTKSKTWSTVMTCDGFEPGSGEHYWVVRVDRSDRGHVFVGIGTASCSLDTYVGGDDQGWGLIGTKALWHNRSKVKSSYGDGFNSGSSVHIRYDADNGKLYFSDDKISTWGLAFDNIPPVTVYAAVSLYQRDDRVLLNGYGCNSGALLASNSGISYNLASPDLFAIANPFVVFALSIFDSIEDILAIVEADSAVGADVAAQTVAALTHPFISVVLPIISSALAMNTLSSELSTYVSVHLLPHLTLLTKRLSSIHDTLEKTVVEKNSVEADKYSPECVSMLQRIVDKEFGLVGNVSGLWRINSSAGGSAIPAQEYYIQIFSSAFRDSHCDKVASGLENVDVSDEGIGKYKPLLLTGTGHGQSANVSINGTVFGTRIRFNEQWHLGGTCLIDARLSLDGSSFYGSFKDIKSGIMGSISAYRVLNSAVVSRMLSEEDKLELQKRQTHPSNILIKAALLSAMACGRLSADMIVSTKVMLPMSNLKLAGHDGGDSFREGIPRISLTRSGEFGDSDDKADEDELTASISGESDVGDRKKISIEQESAALITQWVRNDLFSEGLSLTCGFVNFIGAQLQNYFSIAKYPRSFILPTKAVEVKWWWLRQVFHGLGEYCALDEALASPEVDSPCFRVRSLSHLNDTSKRLFSASSTVDSPDHIVYQQLYQNVGGSKCLDEYVVSHVGLSSLCKIGGECMQAARRRVLAGLIFHSGYLEVCTAEIQSLNENSRDCKPTLILLDIWRAAQKVIEHYIRQKQRTGKSYNLLSQELCKKTSFLMEVVPNSLCKDVSRTLQTTLSSELSKKRSFDIYGTPVNTSIEKAYNPKNLSATVDFLQSDVDIDSLRMELQRVSLKTYFRSAGLKSVTLLLGKGISAGSAFSTFSSGRIPALNTLMVQSAIIEYILPSIHGISDFTSELNSRWTSEVPSSPSSLSTLHPKDPTDSDSCQGRLSKRKEKDFSLSGHFSDELQGASMKFHIELRQSFESLYELVTHILHRCTWAGDRDGQCVALSAWDITVLPNDHAFLNRIGIFRLLQTVLDDTRSFLGKFASGNLQSTQNVDDLSEEQKSSIFGREIIVSASKRLTQLALKIVHTLASQIAFCKDEDDDDADGSQLSEALPPLNRQASGPETLSQALFDMLYTELFACLKQIVLKSQGMGMEDRAIPDVTTDVSEYDKRVLLSPTSSHQYEEIGGEKYAYRILRLLFSVASSVVCRKYLCSPKWLTLLLSGVGYGGLSVQRRLMRLLRKLLTGLIPQDVRAYTTDFFDITDEIYLSEKALDDDDIECLIASSDEVMATDCSSPDFNAERIIKLFLKASTTHILPREEFESNDKRNSFLLSLFGIPSGTNSLCAESISLLRMIGEIPSWKDTLCRALRQPLQAFIYGNMSAWNNPSHLRDVVASMGVLGGYVDRVRVGGTVTLKPFSLVGLSETFALRLAAVSHSCGLVVSKNSKSIELVLMERSRKYLKAEVEGGNEKGKYTAQYVMSLAGGTPIRSVKMTSADVIPAADVLTSPDFFNDDLWKDCLKFVHSLCLPLVEMNFEELQKIRDLKKDLAKSKKEVEEGDDERMDYEGELFDDDFVDDEEESFKKLRSRRKVFEKNESPRIKDEMDEFDFDKSANVISDVQALQLYVGTVSFRALSSWMQCPSSFAACKDSDRAAIQAFLEFAVKPVQVGGLGELEAIEERWASVWESYSLLKYKDMQSDTTKKSQATKISRSSIFEAPPRSEPSLDSTTTHESPYRRSAPRSSGNGNNNGRASGGGGGSGGGGSLSSGMLASMLSTPSAGDAARAREQMMDMGFPKEWCDVALRRCRYNVELAINLCFEHGSEMNQLVAEEAAMQSARNSSGTGGGTSSRQMNSQSESISIFERLANRSSRNSEDSGVRIPGHRDGTSSRTGGSHSRQRLFSLGFPESWCNYAMEFCDDDIDASITWIMEHRDELIAAEELAAKPDGKPIEELLAAIDDPNDTGSDDGSEDACIQAEFKDSSNDKASAFVDSPNVDCRRALSTICGSAIIDCEKLSCGGIRSSGFPSVGCRGFAVNSGKWYYEVVLDTAGCIQVGWVDIAYTGNSEAGEGVGDCSHSWAYDGWRLLKWNGSSAEWGAKWSVGDTVGCALDMENGEMSFFLNGYSQEINMGLAFHNFNYFGGLFPCLSYNRSEKCSFIFNGKEFKHRPPPGYRPFAEHIQATMQRNFSLVKRYLETKDEDVKTVLQPENEICDYALYALEDCLEEQRGENDFLSHKRYFQPDESRSGNNQLERQCQQLTMKIISAEKPDSREGLLTEFQSLSTELCILHSRLIILRILSGYSRQYSNEDSNAVKYRALLFDNVTSIERVLYIVKECSATSLRTKVYLQTMSILSSSSLPPPNLGSVLTVGGFPTLNAVTEAISFALGTGSRGCNKDLLDGMLRFLNNELVNSCRREFAADWEVESGHTPVIYKDILTLSQQEYESNGELRRSVPSLSLCVWLSSIIMQQLFVQQVSNFEKQTVLDFEFILQWFERLACGWAFAMKSPVIAVKMCSARNMSCIIQQIFFSNGRSMNSSLFPQAFFSKMKLILSANFSLDRIEKLVLHRMVDERGSYPICSEYLQSILELAVTLRSALEGEFGAVESETGSYLPHPEEMRTYPASGVETDSNDCNFNWDAFTGSMLSDDGWEVWTGNVNQLEATFTKPEAPKRAMSFSGRQHESIPPPLLPGCKVMRRKRVPVVAYRQGGNESSSDSKELNRNESELRCQKGLATFNNSDADDERTEDSPSRDSAQTFRSPSERIRSSIAKLLADRGRFSEGDNEPSSDSCKSTTMVEVMEFGTVIGIAAWEGCAPGTARIIKWSTRKSSIDENKSDNIETVRWGGEGRYDVSHVELDSKSKRKNKILTQYPPPTSFEEVASKYGFGSKISFGVVLRLRPTTLTKCDIEDGADERKDGVMEWPEFKAIVYVSAVRHGPRDWLLTEEKLISGSAQTGWWSRFGTSSWRPGTTYDLSFPTHSALEYAKVSSGKQLLGQFSYGVHCFVGQSIHVAGDIMLQQSQLFTFDLTYHAQSIQISNDKLAAACSGGEGKSLAFANVGFSCGVHYWEYKVEQCDLGNIYIGVAEKPTVPNPGSLPRLNKWYGYGFVNMRTSYRHTQSGSGERVYGDIFHTGDTVGVLLDMNRGALSFFLDGMKYGEHLLTDLGVAFDGLVNGNASSVQPKTLYPVVGFRRSGDRVTITPRWISTAGSYDMFDELSAVKRSWELLSHWSCTRPSTSPREQDLWTYREAWRDWLRWRSDRYLKVRTRCHSISLNLTASLDKSPRACVDASIRLGLTVALFHGDRIVFKSSCGRKLEAKEDAVVLGSLRGQLWYRLDSQREGDRGAMLEGSSTNLAWCFAPYDMEDIELVRRGSVLNLLPRSVLNMPLARIPVYQGGLLRVVYDQGAIMRDGIEIDAADVVCTIAHDAMIYAVERRVNSSSIARYRVYYGGSFGWISEKIRGGSEEFMVSRVSVDSENIALFQRLRDEAIAEAGGTSIQPLFSTTEAASPSDAFDLWCQSIRDLQGADADNSLDSESICIDYLSLFTSGGMLSVEFRRSSTESFGEFLDLSTSMDGIKNWPAECDMLLAEFISHTATKEGQSPYNLSCEQIKSALVSLSEKSPLRNIDPMRIIARAAVIRVANSLIGSSYPYFNLTLPEEKWNVDCFGSREIDASNQVTCDNSHPLSRMDREMNFLGDNFNQLAMNSCCVWSPPCGARRMHTMRRVIFTQTKKIYWDNILESTTTATALNQDEYEDPREIKQIRINRVKATQTKLASIPNMAERIRQSVFGQLHREMRQWPSSAFRRSYLGKGHGGQHRAFKVKFMGEGVNDYGGPYRAVFDQIVDELQCDSTNVGIKSSDRCLLPLLVPCPNRSTAVGPNQDKFLFATSSSPLIQELMQFFGKLSGTALRHNLNLNLNLSSLLWRPMVRLPTSLLHLETVDCLTVKHLKSIEELGLKLEGDENGYDNDYIPKDWVDSFFTVTFADGTKSSLVPGGEDIPLTLGNWRVYLSLVERIRLRESSVLYKAFRNGLSSVLPVELFSIFTAAEMDQLFSGNHMVDVNLLKQCTEYEGISPDSDLANYFWSVLEDMSDDERTSFLRFVWARSRMPASAHDLPMNFKLQIDNSLGGEGGDGVNPDEFLPHAQTCFFSLSLPNYSSKEALRKKLLYAINNSPNMDADVRLHNAEGWSEV